MNVILFRRNRHGRPGGSARMPSRPRGQTGPLHRAQSNRPARRQATRNSFTAISSTIPISKPISPDSTPASSASESTSAGMTEAQLHPTSPHDLTLAAATTLAKLNPSMTFIYVLRSRNRQHRARPQHVGSRQGQNRKRYPQTPLQSGLTCSGLDSFSHFTAIVSKTKSYRIFYSGLNTNPSSHKEDLSHPDRHHRADRPRDAPGSSSMASPRPVLESKDINTLQPPLWKKI